MRKVLCSLAALALIGCGGPADPAKQAQTWLDKGVAQFQKQNYDQAIASITKSLELQPKSAVAYNFLGMAYRFKFNQVRNQELKQKEIAAFEKALEIDPSYWVALINLGATYYAQGDKAKAVPLFRKALIINPQHPEKAEIERIIAAGEEK
jgi:tetratricopeptide (TPR) repeat protein